MNPTTDYSVTEVNNLKSFAAGGGRIVFIGEQTGYYVGAAVEEALFPQLGSEMSIVNGLVACSNSAVDAAHIRPHSTTVGVSSLTLPCSAGLTFGPNDYPIALGQVDLTSAFLPVIAVVKVDITQVILSEIDVAGRRTIRRRAPSVLAHPPTIDGAMLSDPRGKSLRKP